MMVIYADHWNRLWMGWRHFWTIYDTMEGYL